MRIKCDHCGYSEPVPNGPTEDLIGKRCPECASDMMTKQDFEDGKRMYDLLKGFEEIGLVKLLDSPSASSYSVNPHKGSVLVTPPKR